MKDNINLKVALIILFIFMFTGIPRFLSISDGLPYSQYWDEPSITRGAINGLKRAFDEDKNTNMLAVGDEVVYGGFMRYTCMAIDIIYYQYLKITDSYVYSLNDIKTDIHGEQPQTISHPGFYYLNRLYTSILSILGFVFLFLLGRLRYGTINGLVAALILAANYAYFQSSFIVWVNVPLSTWIIATLYFAVKYNHSKSFTDLIYSLVCVGLAMSTKMTGAAVVIVPLIAGLLNYDLLKKNNPTKTILKAFYLGLIPLGVFILLNPSVYLNQKHFLLWMNWLSEIYKTGGGHFSKEPGWDHLSYQLGELALNMGTVFILFSLFGLLVGFVKLIKHKRSVPRNYTSDILIITIFPIFYILYITTQYSIAYHRNFLLLYPILCLLAAGGINYIIEIITDLIKWFKPFKRWFSLISILLVFIISWSKYSKIYSTGFKINKSINTRTQAVNYIEGLSKNKQINLGVERGLRLSLHDLRKSNLSYGYFNIEDLDEATKGFTHLLTPAYQYKFRDSLAFSSKIISKLDTLIKGLMIKSIPGSMINYYHDLTPWTPIRNPRVNILKGSTYPPPRMEQYKIPIINKLSLFIVDHIPVLVYRGKLEPGEYMLKFKISGIEALGEYPEMVVLQNNTEIATLKTETVNFVDTQIEIGIFQSATIKIYFRMTNDYYNESTGEDRNIIIKNLELRKLYEK